jgi:hypothetical protein
VLARLPGIRAPTTSSSGNPSISLFAPALSEGGPRGLAEDERMCCDSLALPASLEGVGAASELRTASSKDDMMCLWRLCLVLFVAGSGIEAGVLARGSVNTRNAGRAGWIGKSNYLVRACYHHITERCYSAVIYVANMFKVITVIKVVIRVLIRNAFVDTTKVEMATVKGYTAYPVHPKRKETNQALWSKS